MTGPRKQTMIAAFGVADGQLAVGGLPLERLAARAGSTPFFAYDRQLLTERVDYLRATLPPGIDLSYAMKANPMPAVVQHLARLVDSVDVASTLEMRTALDTPLPSHQITFAGPGKTGDEIAQAVAAGVLIEMESRTEVWRVLDAGEQLGLTPRVALRVNPNFAVKGSGMRMGGGPQQFGVDAEEVPDLLAELAATGLDFVGFHIFAGSQNLHADILCEAQRRTVHLLLELATKAPDPVTYLNLGGGFGIPYFDKDEPLDVAPIADNLHKLLTDQIEPQLPGARTCLEFGRYLVGEAGVYVTRVVDRKESRGQLYLVVDGGMHHQLAASGNFGQVIRRNYPLALGNRIDEPPDTTATVVGCLCTPLDLLGDKVELPDPRVGDLVVLFQAGAYGLTASPTAFLGHAAPVELLV
jgi:diaminopimelate decarboxylase